MIRERQPAGGRNSCRRRRSTCQPLLGAALLVLLAGAAATPARAGITARLTPTAGQVAVGAIFDVDVVVEDGDAFNGFDLVIGYDPSRLVFLGQPRTGAPGELMTEACGGAPFHFFDVSPDSSRLAVSYVLLCSGVEVAGPGRIYTVRFQARDVPGATGIDLGPGTRFFAAGIQVGAVDLAGTEVQIGTASAVPDRAPAVAPLVAAPNPFNPRTQLRFELPEAGPVRLRVLDLRGRVVRRLVEESRPAGPLVALWSGEDDAGRPQPGGLYLAELAYVAAGRPARAVTKLVLVP
ncbi:hypothetical protein KDM41_14370 [bacterium]|nr:hypothetical protein [bacterium]